MSDTSYSIELAEQICDAVATTPMGITALCAINKDWPTARIIFRWLVKHPEFTDMYSRARKAQIEVLIDQVMQLVTDTSKDWVRKQGEICADHDHISRVRLQIDSIKWLATKLLPKVYGDKIQTEHTGSIGLHEQALLALK